MSCSYPLYLHPDAILPHSNSLIAMEQSRKRPPSPDLIPNPLIKKRNLTWSLDSPSSHPHPPHSISTASISGRPTAGTTAAIESGAVEISDHLARFSSTLSSHLRPTSAGIPRLSVERYSHLYQRCLGSPSGAHFVVHQHDHPVAGTHYDLRLQINDTSSASWAIMYGLPGDANSSRPSRNATETRIHCLWNHLVETASPETGSLLIWDTGTYSILPRPSKHQPAPSHDPSSPPASHLSSPSPSPSSPQTAQSLLHAAFQNRKIRLRLHGAKLPDPYVINLRLTKSEDAAGRSRGLQTRRAAGRRRGRTTRVQPQERETSPSSASSSNNDACDDDNDLDKEGPIDKAHTEAPDAASLNEQQDAQVRLTNAYHGASNTIGSIHQRRWYLSLDRRACGFTEKRRRGRSLWEPPPATESPSTADDPLSSQPRLSFPFYVRGPQFEQSVVTGRRGEDVLRDEGVTTFVPRKGWTPVMR
ncbi:DNA polymerase ligase domain-containing protein [Trichoderma barbatum]